MCVNLRLTCMMSPVWVSPVWWTDGDGLAEVQRRCSRPPVPFFGGQREDRAAVDVFFQQVDQLFMRAAIKWLDQQNAGSLRALRERQIIGRIRIYDIYDTHFSPLLLIFFIVLYCFMFLEGVYKLTLVSLLSSFPVLICTNFTCTSVNLNKC